MNLAGGKNESRGRIPASRPGFFWIVVAILLVSCNGKPSTDSQTSLLFTAPLVLSTNPVNGAVNVPVNSSITIFFSQSIDQATVTSSTFSFTPAILGTYTVAGSVVSFMPNPGTFQAFTPYTVTLPVGGIKSTSGVSMILQYQFVFTTQ